MLVKKKMTRFLVKKKMTRFLVFLLRKKKRSQKTKNLVIFFLTKKEVKQLKLCLKVNQSGKGAQGFSCFIL